MLQAVHQEKTVARASSIYCRWIREERGECVSLVAVWMDSEMRCFEQEFVLYADGEELCQDAITEPGGAWTKSFAEMHWHQQIPSNRS